MHTDTERFIQLATGPLDDNAELRLAAEAELRKSIEAADRPEALAEAVEALERTDGQPGRWRLVLLGVMLVVSLPLLGHTFWQVWEFSRYRSLFSWTGRELAWEKSVPNLTPAQRLLLFGAEGATNPSDKWKPLWDSEPENPAYLAEYAAAYFRDHKSLSPEILAAAERIDPENSWFLALAAAGTADGAVTKERARANAHT